MQGSGTFCVEATLGSTVRPEDHLLVAANGAYGKRMGVIAEYYGLNCHVMKFDETQAVDPVAVDAYLAEHKEVTHVSVVHCETTTGVLNPLEEIAAVVKRHGKTLIVDAMSSFGGVPIDMAQLGIDFLIRLGQQVHPGRARLRLHHSPPLALGAVQGRCAFAVT